MIMYSSMILKKKICYNIVKFINTVLLWPEFIMMASNILLLDRDTNE